MPVCQLLANKSTARGPGYDPDHPHRFAGVGTLVPVKFLRRSREDLVKSTAYIIE